MKHGRWRSSMLDGLRIKSVAIKFAAWIGILALLWILYAIGSQLWQFLAAPSGTRPSARLKRFMSVESELEYSARTGQIFPKGGQWPTTACGSVNGDYMLAYCFANETTAQRLEDLWMQAWLKWVPALIDSGLHIRPAPPCAPDDYGCICGTPGIDSFSTLRINETTAPTSSATVGFMSDFSKKWANQMNVQITAPDMTLLRKPLVDALDEQWRQYWRAYNTQVIAHELDHVMGLHHEHQRPGAYDIFNSVNPSLIFRPQYLAGYSNAAVTLYTLTENEAPWVKGLDLGARFMAILSNRFLAQKHWPEVVDWVPYSDADLTHLDIVNGGLIDYDSIIIYGTAVGTEFDDHGKSSAVLSQAHGGGGYPDEDEPGGWVYSPVYICGTLDPAACMPSAGDMARIAQLYPRDFFARRRREANQLQGLKAPSSNATHWRPMRVSLGKHNATLRPLPSSTPLHFGSEAYKKLKASIPPVFAKQMSSLTSLDIEITGNDSHQTSAGGAL